MEIHNGEYDWMSTDRVGQLGLAESWLKVTGERGSAWGIPGDETAALRGLLDTAKACLEKVRNQGERTPVDIIECNTAFAELKEKMRFFQQRWFRRPPLSNGDFEALGLWAPDLTEGTKPPAVFAEADVSGPEPGVLDLRCRPVDGQPLPGRGYGYRIYFGVYAPGVPRDTGRRRILTRIPVSGDELPNSKWGRRDSERFYFNGCSGMTAYFCIRCENNGGDAGPWGPVFSAVIP